MFLLNEDSFKFDFTPIQSQTNKFYGEESYTVRVIQVLF
jgi:hypothetical protein